MELFEKKYYPNNVNELLIKDELLEIITSLIDIKELNILFHGNNQCGKTTIINTITKELIEKHNLKSKNIFYLNNFNEQTFVQNINELNIFLNSSIKSDDYKLVVIDDINNFNESNQQNLKNIIDLKKENTYFLCSIDNINDLIEPIQCKLIQIHCDGYCKNKVKKYIENINIKENIQLSDKNINNIITHGNMNINIILNYIEKIYLLDDKNITESFFINIENNHYKNFIDKCKNNNFIDAYEILNNFSNKGYFFLDILEEFYQYLKNNDINYEIIFIICKYIDYFYDGYDDEIILYYFTNDIINLFKK